MTLFESTIPRLPFQCLLTYCSMRHAPPSSQPLALNCLRAKPSANPTTVWAARHLPGSRVFRLAVIGRFQLRQIERSNSSWLSTPIITSSVVTLVRQSTKKCLLQLWSLLGLALASVQPYTGDLKAVRVLWFSTTKAGLICSCVLDSSQVPKTFFERQNSKVGSCLGSSQLIRTYARHCTDCAQFFVMVWYVITWYGMAAYWVSLCYNH